MYESFRDVLYNHLDDYFHSEKLLQQKIQTIINEVKESIKRESKK